MTGVEIKPVRRHQPCPSPDHEYAESLYSKTQNGNHAGEDKGFGTEGGQPHWDEEVLWWDSFKCTPPRQKSGSMAERRGYEVLLRLIKLLVHLLLFVSILGGSLVAELCLLLALSHSGCSSSGRPWVRLRCGADEEGGPPLLLIRGDESRSSQLAWRWVVLVAFAVPELLGLLRFGWSCFFIELRLPRGGSEWVRLGLLSLVEATHTLGLALAFLVGLPELEPLQVLIALNCVFLVPALLEALSGASRGNRSGQDDETTSSEMFGVDASSPKAPTHDRRERPASSTAGGGGPSRLGSDGAGIRALPDFLSLLCQIAGLLYLCSLAHEAHDSSLALWILPPSLMLCSVRWWGNYLPHDLQNGHSGLMGYLSRARSGLQARRSALLGYTCLLRLSVFALSGYAVARLWLHAEPSEIVEAFWTTGGRVSSLAATIPAEPDATTTRADPQRVLVQVVGGLLLRPTLVAIVHALSGILVYSCAKFACKTLMQGAALGVALQLSGPLSLLGLGLLSWSSHYQGPQYPLLRSDECAAGEPPDQWSTRRLVRLRLDAAQQLLMALARMGPPLDAEQEPLWWLALPLGVGLLLLVSRLWLTRHVGRESNERLASTDTIFAVATCDVLLLDQSIALAKWRTNPRDLDYRQLDELGCDEEAQLRMSRRRMASTSTKERDRVTKIYACATMWHESPEEMRDFLNSILRLDRDQCILRVLQKHYRIKTPDYYELEVHVFFDDAFRCARGCAGARVCGHDENLSRVNDWVLSFVRAVEEAVAARKLRAQPAVKYPAPYGGRLLYLLPEGNRMYVHLKDRNRIRTRKRWSQVMYMYYLLGHRLMELPIPVERKEVMAENTYILTLDGDIDFRPSAVRALVDRMKINRDLGSVCSRIHPLGSGPMVWFQKFEYAIGHWLQKATEHTIGSVLCSPGCFALFRANALMDYDVMRKYATVPTEAHHFIQYDQGEDRWLCTLLLQRGYKVEYSAASDAYTHAPESFNEFYVQRRRWIPSTVANIVDLLASAKRTRAANRDISSLFVCYQWILMGSTVLGPGTIFLMLVGSFVAAFRIDNWSSFSYNLVPVLTFCLVCYFCKERTQLAVACAITIAYSLVMVVVLVGVMVQISEDGPTAPSSLLFFAFVGEFVVTALLHPLELGCLAHGPIYFVTVPSMYMLLIVFSLFNMNNVTWGTRDAPTNESPPPAGEERKTSDSEVRASGNPLRSGLDRVRRLLSSAEFGNSNSAVDGQLERVSESLASIQAQLDHLHRSLKTPTNSSSGPNCDVPKPSSSSTSQSSARNVSFAEESNDKVPIGDVVDDAKTVDDGTRDKTPDDGSEIEDLDSLCGDTFLVSPNWIKDRELGDGVIDHLDSKEENFWKQFIRAYLEPIDKDLKREATIAEKVTKLRNQNVFKFFMINCLFGLTIFLMQLKKDLFHLRWPIGVTYNITYSRDEMEVYVDRQYLRLEPIGCLFVVAYLGVLVIQFIAMLFHRFETFSHIMAKVSLEWHCCNKRTDLSEEARIERMAAKITKKLQREVETDSEVTWREQRRLIPPRKRMTVHQTYADVQRDSSYDRTFSTKLENDLELAGPHGDGAFASESTLGPQLLHNRPIVKNQIVNRGSSTTSSEKINYNGSTQGEFSFKNANRRTTLYRTYDNPAFVPE